MSHAKSWYKLNISKPINALPFAEVFCKKWEYKWSKYLKFIREKSLLYIYFIIRYITIDFIIYEFQNRSYRSKSKSIVKSLISHNKALLFKNMESLLNCFFVNCKSIFILLILSLILQRMQENMGSMVSLQKCYFVDYIINRIVSVSLYFTCVMISSFDITNLKTFPGISKQLIQSSRLTLLHGIIIENSIRCNSSGSWIKSTIG